LLQVWPYLLGVYHFNITEDERQTQDHDAQVHYDKLTTDWQAAKQLALKREQENTVPPENPGHSVSERHIHELKMAIFRKDSSLSNDVFESLDAPCGGIVDETCRPETVVEESSSVTSPTSEPRVSSALEPESGELVKSLPVKPGMISSSLELLDGIWSLMTEIFFINLLCKN